MKRWPLCAIVMLGLAASGCDENEVEIADGDDPLRALAVSHLSSRYNTAYWTRKMREDPELWARAEAYCAENNDADHPNCAAVEYVRALEAGSRPPEYEANTSLRPGVQAPPQDGHE
jgi:hypothetical protein